MYARRGRRCPVSCAATPASWPSRLLAEAGLWRRDLVPISAEAVRKRLQRSGPRSLQTLFAQVSAELAAASPGDLSLAPFAAGVYALDDTALDQVARHLPALRGIPKGDDALLPGKLCVAFDVRRQLFTTVLPTELPHQNPKIAAPALYRSLPVGSLLLLDLGYFSFPSSISWATRSIGSSPSSANAPAPPSSIPWWRNPV